jgi:F-type H+-transporting ATPase subunit epsilon
MAIPTALSLEFVTPERAIVHEEVDEVELPGEDGYFGVLPGHAPLLVALQTGTMWYRKGGERKFAFIAGGFAEVLPNRVSILAQVAEKAEDIDVQRAEASKRRAEEQLAKATVVTDFDAERARIALMRAITRLEITKHSRPRN